MADSKAHRDVARAADVAIRSCQHTQGWKQSMSNDYLDDFMKQMYATFGRVNPPDPRTNPAPTRIRHVNYYCHRCGMWVRAAGRMQSHDCE